MARASRYAAGSLCTALKYLYKHTHAAVMMFVTHTCKTLQVLVTSAGTNKHAQARTRNPLNTQQYRELATRLMPECLLTCSCIDGAVSHSCRPAGECTCSLGCSPGMSPLFPAAPPCPLVVSSPGIVVAEQLQTTWHERGDAVPYIGMSGQTSTSDAVLGWTAMLVLFAGHQYHYFLSSNDVNLHKLAHLYVINAHAIMCVQHCDLPPGTDAQPMPQGCGVLVLHGVQHQQRQRKVCR